MENRGHRPIAHAKLDRGYAYGNRKHKFSKMPMIITSSIMIVVCIIILARSFGLFNITLGAANLSSAVSSEGELLSSQIPDPTPTPEPTPEPVPTLAPPEGGAAYTAKYTEMWVPQSEYTPPAEGDKVVYLTFDDGPCGSSGRLLDVLDELDVKVTFFFTAQFLGRDDLVREVKSAYDRGHAVGVHTYMHDYKDLYSSVEAFLDDYKKMDDIIVEATGVRSAIFRFPGGSNAGYNAGIRDALIPEMTRRGFIYHDWNCYNGDSEGYGYDAQIEKAVKETSYNDRSVLLMHNTPDKDVVIDSLYKIIPKLKEMGYRFDVLDETVKPIQFIKAEDYEKTQDTGEEQTKLPDGQHNGSQANADRQQSGPQSSEPYCDPDDPERS